MNRYMTFAVAALAIAALGTPATGQGAGSTAGAISGSGAMPTGNHMGQNNMTQDQFNQMADYADTAKRLTKEDKAKGKTIADLLAEDKAAATALTKSMPLSCDVTDAILAAQGPVTVNGKPIDTKTYEAACANGMGYFLISQDSGKPYGFSCFAADATHAADVAAGRPPGAVCQLPTNANMKTMMATVLSHAGTNCAVRDLKWVGVSSASNIEFNEVACTDGNGYILRTALPGSLMQPNVIACHDSPVACKLTSSGPVVNIQTFKDALAAHKVACTASDSNVRAIGQQPASKRYVVEFQCPEQPKGLVAFIPLNGNTAPFETLNCAAAAKKGAVCKLTAN